ncbi:MAG: hypothetical protein WD649_02195 [Thermoleophilaceae bacterium]
MPPSSATRDESSRAAEKLGEAGFGERAAPSAADRYEEGLRPVRAADERGELDRTLGGRALAAPGRRVQALIDAAANVYDLTLGDMGIAPRPKPSSIIDDGPQRTVHRYEPRSDRHHGTLLLIPPLAGPASCFDLRPGVSMVEYFTWLGYRTYVVDYGPISFSDRTLGLEHWVDEVLPLGIEAAAEDAGEEVHAAGWCLGGIMALLSLAAHEDLPAKSLTLVASPFDFSRVPLMAPIKQLGEKTGGAIVGTALRALGGIPAPLVSAGFRLTSVDRYVTRPLFVARNLDNREALVHMRAVDAYMAGMLAYPGRSIGQLYHSFFHGGELAEGEVALGKRTIDLASVKLPVLAVAGRSDVLAPPEASHVVGELLPNAEVRLETAPGGHLGVLTGMSARKNTWALMREFVEPGANGDAQ